MKIVKRLIFGIVVSVLSFLVSCTDSTTEDATSNSETDTLFVNIPETTFTGIYDTVGFTLLVNTISKEQYDGLTSGLFDEDSLRSAICGDKEGGCMEAMEQFYISKVSDKVKRKDKELVLSLSNGKSLTLTNNLSEDDGYEVYQFQKLDDNGYYTVAVFYYESYGYYLINSANGKSTFTIGAPVASPDKKQYVSVNYDMVAAFTFNGLELLTSSTDSAVSAVKIDFVSWGPEEIKWKDDSTLYVKQKSQQGESKEENNYAAIRIKRRSGI